MTPFSVQRPDLTLEGRIFPTTDPEAPTVLMVHGFPDSSSVWGPLIAELSPRYRVVTYDVRGAGRSGAPASVADYDLERLMGDLGAVIERVSPQAPVHLVGHDWGAIQGWEAVTRAELVPRLASFTALSAPGFDAAGRWLRRRLLRPSAAGLVDLVAQARRSWYVAAFQLPRVPELAWRALGERAFNALARREGIASPDFPAPTVARDAALGINLYRANAGRVLAPRSGPTAVPTQVVNGADDAFVSPRLYKDLPPEIACTVLPGAGHWLPRSHPVELARLVTRHIERVGAGLVRAPASAAPPSVATLRPRPFKPSRRDWNDTALSWIPGEPFASHAIDALSLLLPAGERWFVRVFKQALPLIRDAQLRADMRGFMGQEAAHAVAHAHLLERHFAARGIAVLPFTERIERLFAFFGERPLPAPLKRHWLQLRVAGVASIEHYTGILGDWILGAKGLDQAGADPEMLRLYRWHGAEEVEHTQVAFDVFHHLYGRHSQHGSMARALAQLELAAVHVGLVTPVFVAAMMGGADYLMNADPGIARGAPRGYAALAAAARRGVLPDLWRDVVRPGLDFLRPGFDPLEHVDRGRAQAFLATAPQGAGHA